MEVLNAQLSSGCTGNATVSEALFQRQLNLERKMEENGTRSVEKLLTQAREKTNESNTLYDSVLLKKGVESLTEGINAFLAEAEGGKVGRRHIASRLLEEFQISV